LKTLSQNPANNKVRQRLVLVTGDSDFVPAAKLARREGVEFLLDPLWQQVSDELNEHVDGVVSAFPKPAVAGQARIAA
jgi:uncharacterized LabA/DUF88 family protein